MGLLPTFKGLPNEDPYDHIEEFEKACDTISIAGVPKDAIRMRAFPYTLKESAHHWCKMLEERIEEWGTLKDRFLRKYFPVGKQNALGNVIETFSQLPNERFFETLDRYKEAIRKCPTHGIQKHRLIEYFYIGLTSQSRSILDAACGGYVQDLHEEDAWKIIEKLSESSRDSASHETFSRHVKPNHAHKVEEEINTGILCAQIDKYGIFQKQILEKLDSLNNNFEKRTTPQLVKGVEEFQMPNEVQWVQGNQNQT